MTLNLDINSNSTSPIQLQLVLDNWCRETSWSIVDEFGITWYDEGPYDCDPSGGGLQAEDTINVDLVLDTGLCYTFTLFDAFGDGLAGSLWGYNDGSWLLSDYNNNTLIQGTGNFGYEIFVDFKVIESVPILVHEGYDGVRLNAYPNPFEDFTNISIDNLNGPFEISLYDMYGKVIVDRKMEYNNNFEISNKNLSRGIYWLKIENYPDLPALKLIKW